MVNKLVMFLFFILPISGSFASSSNSLCWDFSQASGVWTVKDISMRASYKGKDASWICPILELNIQNFANGFQITKCTAHCGEYWGSYNCLTAPIKVSGNELSYNFSDGTSKSIGTCNASTIRFANERSVVSNETWPLVGRGDWTLEKSMTDIKFSFKHFTTQDPNDFWEIEPVLLPIQSP